MEALRKALSSRFDNQPAAVDEERGILDSISDRTTLAFSTRVKLFVCCFLMGIVFSMLGTIILFFGVISKLPAFAALYTIGNLFSIGSTCFLMGPIKQIKNMFASNRIISTIVLICAFFLTLLAAFWVKSAPLALVMVCIQSLALTWYSLSYIPYAQEAVSKIICSFVK